jgi:ABC-2 type transport system permease protein
MIGAILRAQWLSMRWGGRRGATWSIVTACLWYGFWCSIAVMLSALARGAGAPELERVLPLAFLLVSLYWQIVPVISASMGSGLDMRKLLVYPTPHGKLFLVEVLLRLTTGGEMLLVLTGGAVGLLLNPKLKAAKPGAAIAILVSIVIWIAFNALLASGLRSLLERLLARRRVREILVFFLVLATAVPRMLLLLHIRPRSFGWLEGVSSAAILPWAAAARVILGPERLLSLLTAGLWTLAAGWFGRAQFERSLRFDAMAAQATPVAARSGSVSRAETMSERLFRLPARFFGDPLAVLVEKELRSLARTPRFRMVFVMGFAFGLMVWVPLVLGGQTERNGWLEQNLLAVVSVYALTLLGQVTYWNCFGFDRSAVGIYLAAPQPIRLTLVGKNIASLVFIYLEVVILSVLTEAFRLTTGMGKVMEAVFVVGVSSLYMLAFGNISSVQYPRALKPERVSQGGASSRFQAVVFILYPLALVPVAMAYLARYAFDSELAFGIALVCAAVLGGFVYWLGLDSAVRTTTLQRERLLVDLSGGEGPIASD